MISPLSNSLTNIIYNVKIGLTLNELKKRNDVEVLKMKKTFKKLLTIVSAVVLLCSMSSFVYAADDVVLNDSGSPFIKTFDPGDKGDYKYMGYAYCFEVGPEYKYMKITYTGDKTAFDELRLEFVVNSDPGDEIKLTPVWFRENEEGTVLTVEGKEVPAPSDKEQTAIIDLEKSGIDLKTGIRAFHIHDTPGKGSFKIIDARLMTSAPGAKDTGSSDNTNSGDDKKDTGDNSKSAQGGATDSADNTATSSKGSTNAPSTAAPIWPIAAAVGGIAVAGIAFGVSRKFKED